nr:unnamed protein product [Callosobruchus chinensis]
MVKECLHRKYKYLHRLRQIWSLELSGNNKAAGANMLAVLFFIHTFDAAFWTVEVGSVLAPILFLLHINDLLSSTTNPIHSFADDSTLHAGIMSNRPISVVELECRRLAKAASLSKDLEAITAWGLKNMVEFNASKTQYCTLSNKRCPSEHSVLMNNQALPRSHSFKLLGVCITKNMIWHEKVSSIATAAGKKLGYLFRARKYLSPSNLLTLYKAQIRPSLEYCSHIWGAAAPTTLSLLDAVQRRAIRLIGDPALTCHLQSLSHRRAVGVRWHGLRPWHNTLLNIPPVDIYIEGEAKMSAYRMQCNGNWFYHPAMKHTTILDKIRCDILEMPPDRMSGVVDTEIPYIVHLSDRKCEEAVETAKHFIFDCPALCRRRSSYLEVVQEEGRQVSIVSIVQCITQFAKNLGWGSV